MSAHESGLAAGRATKENYSLNGENLSASKTASKSGKNQKQKNSVFKNSANAKTAKTRSKEISEKINLSSEEIAEVRCQVKQLRTWRNNPNFAFEDDNLNLIYKNKVKICIGRLKDELRCTSCVGGCDEAYQTDRIFVCPKLPETLHNETKIQSIVSKQVGQYTYKQIPNQSQQYYWYIQFTEYLDVVGGGKSKKKVGKSKSIYLGKETPSFDPEKDLKKAKSKKKSNNLTKAALGK